MEKSKILKRLKSESLILNPGHSISAVNLSDRRSLENALAEWRGAKNHPEADDGYYFNRSTNRWRPSRLLVAKLQIQELEKEFEGYCQQIMNTGKRRPEKPSDKLQERMDKAFAQRDLCLAEIEEIQELLSNFKDDDKKQKEENVLKRGPQGSGKMRHGVLSIIDGQTVIKNDKGMLEIDNPGGPYHKMQVVDYYEKVVKVWAKENAKMYKEFREKARKIRLTDPSAQFGNPPKAKWPLADGLHERRANKLARHKAAMEKNKAA